VQLEIRRIVYDLQFYTFIIPWFTPRVEVFEDLFLGDRENMLKGLPPRFFKAHEVHELDISYSRQPKTVREEALRSMFNGLFAEKVG
jgi:hypothetical protein